MGCAKTGSGKTAAFALPILQRLSEDPYGVFALVLTPTRFVHGWLKSVQVDLISEQLLTFKNCINDGRADSQFVPVLCSFSR